MSRAQELLAHRQKRGATIELSEMSVNPDADSMETYYSRILSDAEIEAALQEYKDNLEQVQLEFLEKTRLQKADLSFLMLAVILQCARIYIINNLTEIQDAGPKNVKEKKLHKLQENILGKFGREDSKSSILSKNELYVPLETIISTVGVPYDVSRGANGILSGANHRFTTLGHDPVLGLIFGTANILTGTITTTPGNGCGTYCVKYNIFGKNPYIIPEEIGTLKMLQSAVNRFDNDLQSVAAAVIKQLIHMATDVYTNKGLTLPGAGLVMDRASVEKLANYINTGDVLKIGASAGISILINTLIAAVHGCKLMLENNGADSDIDLYQARTRKIVMYSNVIASSSNLISTAITGNAKSLDVGGLAVTIYRVFCDARFISKLEYEFINGGVREIYDDEYMKAARVLG